MVAHAWIIMVLPVVYIFSGYCLGTLAAWLGRVPRKRWPLVQACVCIGNSTGIPIVLLSAIQSNVIPKVIYLRDACCLSLSDPCC